MIHTEAGSAWLSMEWKMAVGEVLLNRVASPEFPDTLAGCAFQPGQYTAADEDWFEVLLPLPRLRGGPPSACSRARGC